MSTSTPAPGVSISIPTLHLNRPRNLKYFMCITHHFHDDVSAGPRNIPYLFKNIRTTNLHERNKAYFKRKWNIAE